MTLLKKAQILGAVDRKWEDVNVPEWGGEVRLIAITADERANVLQMMPERRDMLLVAYGLIDDNFDQVFGISNAWEVNRLDSSVVSRLAAKVRELSGMADKPDADA